MAVVDICSFVNSKFPVVRFRGSRPNRSPTIYQDQNLSCFTSNGPVFLCYYSLDLVPGIYRMLHIPPPNVTLLLQGEHFPDIGYWWLLYFIYSTHSISSKECRIHKLHFRPTQFSPKDVRKSKLHFRPIQFRSNLQNGKQTNLNTLNTLIHTLNTLIHTPNTLIHTHFEIQISCTNCSMISRNWLWCRRICSKRTKFKAPINVVQQFSVVIMMSPKLSMRKAVWKPIVIPTDPTTYHDQKVYSQPQMFRDE